jgi:hypothetical protein
MAAPESNSASPKYRLGLSPCYVQLATPRETVDAHGANQRGPTGRPDVLVGDP